MPANKKTPARKRPAGLPKTNAKPVAQTAPPAEPGGQPRMMINLQIDAQLLGAALKFLERVDMKGAEVPAYNAVMNALAQPLAQLQQAQQAGGQPQ